MRFSAVQEDGYGVGLGQENFPNNYVENSMMAATGEIVSDGENTVDESSMTYNLPLLFANGYPTSLDKISLPELERFITFMVQCSSGGPDASNISLPQWWPKEIKFSVPFSRPQKVNDNWLGNLKKLVFRCYTYHRSEYLLRFCSYLAQYPREKLYYVNNWDSTTSLYHRSTGKLLATFRNENMEYDKIVESPRRSLLPPNGVTSSSSGKTKKAKERKQIQENDPSLVVIRPQMEEIYLCDNCDAEFGELDKMKDHEKICGGPVQTGAVLRPITPVENIVDPELDQNQFLDYFKLLGANEEPKASIQSKSPVTAVPTIAVNSIAESTRSSRRIRTTVNPTRCPTIPFSSPAGLAMVKKSRTMTEDTQQERIDRIERHTCAPPLNKFNRPKWLDRVIEYNRWNVTYKPNREKPARDNYVHKYTFGRFKRKYALSIRSQLLFVACRSLFVRLERLTTDQLEDLKENPWKYRSPVRKLKPKNRPKSMIKVGPASIGELKREMPPATSSTKSCSIEMKRMKMNIELHNAKRKSFCLQRRSEPPKTIVLVDLCSSDDDDDDEDEPSDPVLSDENRDPLCLSESPPITNFFKNIGIHANKIRSKSLGYPSDSVNDWIRDSVLTDDNENCSGTINGLTNVVIDASSQFTSILKTP